MAPTLRLGTERTVLDPHALGVRDGVIYHDPCRLADRLWPFDAWFRDHPEWPAVPLDTARAGP